MRIPSVNLHPVLRWTLGVAGFYAVLVLFLWMYIHIANWDLGDRLIETKTVRERGPHEKDSPVVRLVLHRLFPDENSIEVSTVVTLSSSFCDDLLAHGVDHLEVQVEDFTGIQPISQLNTVHVDLKKRVPGFGELSVESERFRLPFFPSLVGFPFDSMRIRFYTAVRMPNWVGADAVLEVQKAIPGRTMEVGLDGGAVSVSISRSPPSRAS